MMTEGEATRQGASGFGCHDCDHREPGKLDCQKSRSGFGRFCKECQQLGFICQSWQLVGTAKIAAQDAEIAELRAQVEALESDASICADFIAHNFPGYEDLLSWNGGQQLSDYAWGKAAMRLQAALDARAAARKEGK